MCNAYRQKKPSHPSPAVTTKAPHKYESRRSLPGDFSAKQLHSEKDLTKIEKMQDYMA
jgi:hypothetical protein